MDLEFKIHTLGYDFLCRNHKHLAKVSRLLFEDFFLEIFKIHRLIWISYGFLVVLMVFLQCFV
jgi:hypothetical protein